MCSSPRTDGLVGSLRSITNNGSVFLKVTK